MLGLIDAHRHITSMPEFLDAAGHLRQSLPAVETVRACQDFGATATANVGGCPRNVILRDAIKEGRLGPLPTLLVGAIVNATGGQVRGRAADGPWEDNALCYCGDGRAQTNTAGRGRRRSGALLAVW